MPEPRALIHEGAIPMAESYPPNGDGDIQWRRS